MNPRILKSARFVGLIAIVIAIAFLLSPAGAHVTSSFRHLWRDHIKPKIATPGTINAARNPVDWTKLKSVPPDFADGVDDAAGGGGGGVGGLHNVTIIEVSSGSTPDNLKGETALCPGGDTIVGGGVDLTGAGFQSVAVDRTRPTAAGDGWIGGAHEHTPTGDNWAILVYAICATP
jgi:hypothetical protein